MYNAVILNFALNSTLSLARMIMIILVPEATLSCLPWSIISFKYSGINLLHKSRNLFKLGNRSIAHHLKQLLLTKVDINHTKLSEVVIKAPACLIRASAIGISSLLQLLTPSLMTYT
jgi:hypothetical protein